MPVTQSLGLRFRPCGFRPFLTTPVSTPTDRVLDIEEIFGLAAALVRGFRPAPDPAIDKAARLVEAISTDPSVLRVSQLAAIADMSARQLQRMFAEYVGIGPKWVIRRARIQGAAARAATEPQEWSALAAELGYAGQAHFTRDFTASIGTSRRSTRVRRDAGTTSGRRGMASFNRYTSLNNESLRRNDLREVPTPATPGHGAGRPRLRP
ncbi:helix-turn-helix domain-containing protein [Streptomyces coeruleorubidus]|uniref:helix-turn-helix domain-containing protein n=1 Tax=Streptomyces coeruleorubidus TaxID=116188 RepID=UPI0037A0A349